MIVVALPTAYNVSYATIPPYLTCRISTPTSSAMRCCALPAY